MPAKKQTTPEPISVFISHRHIDSDLADIFREEISDWCGGVAKIYQSSNAQSASKIGTRLDVAVAEAISTANLVLLVYTDAPGDYDWCMYECGLAQDPASLESNIAVFYTTEDLPDPMDNRVGIRLTSESIHKFVFDFHRTEDFFARRQAPYNEAATDEYIEKKATRLCNRLKKVAPNLSADITVYDRITLGLDEQHVDQLMKAGDKGGMNKALELATQMVPKFAIVRSFSGDPQEHFNYDTFKEAMPVGELFRRWDQDSDKDANSGWQIEICHAIAAAVMNRPERPVSTPLKSLSDSQWLLPLLARFRIIPYEDVYEFDILFCKLEQDAAKKLVMV